MGSSNEHVRADSANKLLVGFDNVRPGLSQKTQTLCYANSILQVLFHHPIFASIVEDIQYILSKIDS